MFYFINTADRRGTSYACQDLSFIERTCSGICPHCKRELYKSQFSSPIPILALRGGKRYPDLLIYFNIGRTPDNSLFMLSERALEIFEQNSVTGYSGYYQVPIGADANKDTSQRPNYYALDISGRIDFDYAAMHLRKKHVCPECGHFQLSRTRLWPYIMDTSTWNGSDLCLHSSLPGYRICTDRLKKIIEKNKLKNFAFEEVQQSPPAPESPAPQK